MALEDTRKTVPPCQHEGDTAHAVFAAVAQMALALRESRDAVAEIGSLFARQAQALAAARTGEPGQLRADVSKGIQQLQFYDRLVQHLSHIQDYLIAVANELDASKPHSHSQGFWDALHAKFRARLISTSRCSDIPKSTIPLSD